MGPDTGTAGADGPLSTLQSALEWAAFLFAVSPDHEDQQPEFRNRLPLLIRWVYSRTRVSLDDPECHR